MILVRPIKKSYENSETFVYIIVMHRFMSVVIWLLLAFCWAPAGFSQSIRASHPFDDLQKADEAYKNQNYQSFLRFALIAEKKAPSHPTALFTLARAYALNGHPKKAIRTLNDIVKIGGVEVLAAPTNPDFAVLKRNPYFLKLLHGIRKLQTPIEKSAVAFTIPEKDIIPEGTAYDPVTKTLFVSSMYKRKVISISEAGEIEDFIYQKQDGIWGVLGMEVDPIRRVLWVASAAGNRGRIVDFTEDDRGKSGIFKFDLNTRKLLKKYIIDSEKGSHLFNDLAVASNGDLYATETLHHAVYKIANGSDKLAVLVKPDVSKRRFYNGIAITLDDKFLFVAHATNITVVDLSSKESWALRTPKDVSLSSVDGLSFYRGSLIAHQRITLGSVNRYYLSSDMKRVLRKRIIDAHHRAFNVPTTGAIVKDSYYYIANAQMHSFDEAKIWDMDRLKEVVILKASLK